MARMADEKMVYQIRTSGQWWCTVCRVEIQPGTTVLHELEYPADHSRGRWEGTLDE